MKRIGFTGTRGPLTEAQRDALERVLSQEGRQSAEVHHGDCVGADATCHAIAQLLGFEVVIHPPSADCLRARCAGADHCHPPKDYLERNKDIVHATAVLIACPQGLETNRSGTWSTVRYARKLGRPIVIVWPSGEVTRENGA